ncbi:hypothetical protein CLAFUW4_11343 [Fulvia fulva]|uniref:Major facilitator superfamily (MFS) profile domain-containing protein n=1 Tax=Passalora fulva TaxID=5499 RepID=A0A9Q8URQ6_PASFU|nr:uncharacterized protein CLAFUR5_10384 [Fulvia fulva]KAK4619572.1 hypothetical protein CLAFUR4_11349 [Fulvia fulva]KAK4620831.1 hypothetical protein CLAFUR0_11355 [Fulvia fulva]UJO19988.1 hypothetical protein CLAFUR5_10384 [Fulvia fulva]WPV17311.1 hypothetical protein CLAFUW4_11343 [Fulvia fulva]WPV31783.1 hypothetical protein CLAFUW7_11339 [Fulvia fulva]
MAKKDSVTEAIQLESGKDDKPRHNEKVLFATTINANDLHPLARKGHVDDAYDFLKNVSDQEAAGVDLKRLRRRIDLHIMPIMFVLMGLQFLDKFLLNYAIIMGLPEDLKLKGNELNNVASSLWWAYLVASAAVGLVLNKVPLGKWLGVSMFLWGIIIALTAAVKNYAGMMVIRIFMGVFDAGIPPALMLLSSQYYRKDEQMIRYAYWFSSIGICLILGGLISYGFQFVHTVTLEGWRIMFLALGLLSVCVGMWTFFCLPDTPMNAKFLTDVEKKAILQHVAINQTTISSRKIEWSQLKCIFSDVQVWLLVMNVVFVSAGSGILGTYGSMLITSFGYTSKQAALLNTPGGAIAFIFTILAALAVRHHILHRWAVSIIGYCLSLLGACMVAFAPRDNKGVMLAGIYMVAFSVPTVAIKYQWVSANVGGYTKRTCTMAIMSGAFSIGNIIAPYAVQPTDAPEFRIAKIVLVSTKSVATAVIGFLALYYLWANRRRDRLYGKLPSVDETAEEYGELWKNETDKEKEKTFRYVY